MGRPVSPEVLRNRAEVMRRIHALYKGAQAPPTPDSAYVSGRGTMNPRVVFVAEHPSAGDARMREPMTGAPGRMLDDLLRGIGWGREHCYITHLVKWHPASAEVYDPSEGLPCFRRELRVLGQPPVVALGAGASELLLPQRKWTDEGHFTGVWHFSLIIHTWVLAMRHPSYAIYQASHLPEMVDQFKSVLAYDNGAGIPARLAEKPEGHHAA